MPEQKEMLDILDDKCNVIGIADRDVVHNYGLWHPTFVAIVLDEESEQVICQVKAQRKHSDNEFEIDFSAGGHFRSGEDPMTSLRELEEELGLDEKDYTPYFLGVRQSAAEIQKNYKEYEWQYIWLIVTKGINLEEINYNDEAKGLVAFDSFDAVDMLTGKSPKLEAIHIVKDHESKGIELTKDNFVPAYITGEQIFVRLLERVCSYRKGNRSLRW